MRIFLQLAVGISLIILAAGTMNYIHDDTTLGGGIILSAAWMAMVALISIAFAFTEERRNKSTKNNLAEKLSNRVKELEKRLIDLQDIVITNDDKLERLEGRSPIQSPSPPQTISD